MTTIIRRHMFNAIVAVIAAANLVTQYRYLRPTNAESSQSAIMLDRLSELGRLAPGVSVVVDVPELGKSHVVALFARGHPIIKFSSEKIVGPIVGPIPGISDERLQPNYSQLMDERYSNLIFHAYKRLEFPIGSDPVSRHQFFQQALPESTSMANAIMVATAADQSVVNNSEDRPSTGKFYLKPLHRVRNHLAQVDSSLAHIVMPGIAEPVGLWQREHDFANPGGGMQAMGRHVLFEVVNPVPGARLLMDFTNSPIAAKTTGLPTAEVIGETRAGLDFIGAGAARVLSSPIQPRIIGGRSYLALDMGADPLKPGAGDPRRIVGFARNISVVTEEQVHAMRSPQAIERFPEDLLNPGLLFSGIYEDGWVADAARVQLGSETQAKSIRIKGELPGIGGLREGARIAIFVDGKELAQRRLAPGAFQLQVGIPAAAGLRWVELRVDNTDRLSPDDPRVASIRLMSIELTGDPSEGPDATMPPQVIKSFPDDLLKHGVPFSGIYNDGWIAEVARIELGSETQTKSIRIKGQLPAIGRLREGARIAVFADGKEVAQQRLAPGDFELQVGIPAAAGPRWVELRVDTADRLSAEDSRMTSVRLRSIGLEEN